MTSTFSSFDGMILEIPGISVDNFERTDCQAYFLSHCHTDHTQGLSSVALMRHLAENDVSIYMSDATAAIISGLPCYDGVKEFLKPLQLGSTTVIKLPGAYNDFYVELTLIPASHCFGSVMFLFRTTYHTVLFTGDFRIAINDVSKFGQLHTKDGEPIVIDKMYVDTTFLDCDYEEFPKRSVCVGYVVNLIDEWLKKDGGNAVALHPSARFGYEYVFNEIYDRLKIGVYVQDGDWVIYSKCQDKVPGVTNKPTCIHKCRNRSEKNQHQNCGLSYTNYLYIHLSAMKWANFDADFLPYHRQSDHRVDVCFATHCSRSEVINFVSYFNPKRVVGFPNPYEVGVDKKEVVKIEFKAVKRKKTGGRKEGRLDR